LKVKSLNKKTNKKQTNKQQQKKKKNSPQVWDFMVLGNPFGSGTLSKALKWMPEMGTNYFIIDIKAGKLIKVSLLPINRKEKEKEKEREKERKNFIFRI
jgi:hypothetical protein